MATAIKSWQAGTLNLQTNDIQEWFKKRGQDQESSPCQWRIVSLNVQELQLSLTMKRKDEPKAKRAKKAHDAEAAVLATNWQYNKESDKIFKQGDCHFKSLRSAKDFNKEPLNVGELLGFVDEHRGKQIMDHPLMREAPMLYNVRSVPILHKNFTENWTLFKYQASPSITK
ncbi:hypothetical protein BC830DRAFT_1215359 [Chytriomyces sp. MP71]|nr:hypothetical protein BC830DRAFT_1215359 [Chytriomyces sp. MP71]